MGGKTIGTLVIGVAVAIGVIPVLMMAPNIMNGTLTAGGFMVCEGPALLIALVAGAAGVYMLQTGKKEQSEQIEVEKEKLILNMVETRGKVKISDISIEMNIPASQVGPYIYDLVGKKLFTGYVDWNGGILQSQQAQDMPMDKCPNCSGALELAGKGVVKCPYCGSEIFLKQT